VAPIASVPFQSIPAAPLLRTQTSAGRAPRIPFF
jgi:hypothetical protein